MTRQEKIVELMRKRIDATLLDMIYQRGAFAPIDPELAEQMRAAGWRWDPLKNDWVRL